MESNKDDEPSAKKLKTKSLKFNEKSNVYYKLKNAKLWFLHFVNTTNTHDHIGLHMTQELFEMLEK